MKSGERDVPGCGAALLVVVATIGLVMLRSIATCLTDATFGPPTLGGCAQEHTDAVIIGGGALALALLILGATLVKRIKQPRREAAVSATDVSVVEFAKMWADEHERFERLAALDLRTQKEAVIEEATSGARYAQVARALGIAVPKDEPLDGEQTTTTDVRGVRALAAGILAVAAVWIAWDSLSCAFARSPLGRCLQEPGRTDSLLLGVGLLVGSVIVALAAPPIWMRDQQPLGVPPWIWIADQWQRLVALGREPTGTEALGRGARVAAAVSDYVQLARPVMNAPHWAKTGKEVSLEKENPLDVAAAFGEQMAQHADAGGYRVRSDRALLYPRKAIRAALYVMLTGTRNEKRRASVAPVLMDLAEYVTEAEFEPYSDAIAAADAYMKHIFDLTKRGMTPEFLEESVRLSRAYDAKSLASLEEIVDRRGAEELAELERRFGDLIGYGSAFKVWFMASSQRVVHAADAIEERKRSRSLDPLLGDQSHEGVRAMLRVLASTELIAEFEEVRKYAARPDDLEQLDLYRGLLSRLEQAHSDLVSTFLIGDRIAFEAAEAAFRKYTDLIRKTQNASTNAELRAMGLGARVHGP